MKDEKLQYFGGSCKNLSFRGGVHEEPIYRGGDCLKRGAWTICRFKGGLAGKTGGGVFERGLIPQCTLCCYNSTVSSSNESQVNLKKY